MPQAISCASDSPATDSNNLLLGSFNSPELLTELRETFASVEDPNQRRDEELHRAKDEERAQHPGTALGRRSPSTSTCSPTHKLSEPNPFGFLRRLLYTAMTD